MEYSYTIIDSDATSNLQLQHYLEDYGDFVCTSQARNCEDGLNAILKYTPDVVFINLNDKAFEYFNDAVDNKIYPIPYLHVYGCAEYIIDDPRYNELRLKLNLPADKHLVALYQ